MKKNVGGYDQLARFVVGPALILVGGAALGGLITLVAGTLGLVLAGIAVFVGTVLTLTAMTQTCPLNAVVGLNTYKDRSAQQSSSEDAKPSTK
ncbi:DUF2892 domain-containing protein [Natronomonas sp. CBA1123]|uniref:YgaP family membrane protein n=1 Tax=Natronomonas sp. CBA1123 TaxID=2668070 RepID=UPI0012EA98AC|nr:DUF2892 domain-containing protein [Natronomonas sp. CBA1123]MUV86192.1 DUF2892 domain-containing protein [Natronomonas sp. CBA1123]